MPCEKIMGLYSSGTLLGTSARIWQSICLILSLHMHNIAQYCTVQNRLDTRIWYTFYIFLPSSRKWHSSASLEKCPSASPPVDLDAPRMITTYNYYISWRHCLRSLGRNFTWLCTHCTSALQSPMPWGWLFLVRPGPDTASRNVLLYSCCQNLSNLWTKSKQQRRTSEEALGLLIPRFHFRFNHTAVELPEKIQACSIYY